MEDHDQEERMADAAIDVSGIRYAYGDVQAVAGVDFSVASGEILGFLGPNGAGKSTTIKMLTGQLDAQVGSISILGRDMPREKDAIQGRIGVCFEEKNLYLNMSAVENLVFFSHLFGLKDFDPGDYLRRVGLYERWDDRVAEYSKGMRQRLMMARTLINSPDVLFLDEPTDGLDPVSSKAIRQIVRDEASRGAAVLLTTHDMLEADKLSDRVAFINEGRILAMDTPERLKLAHGTRAVRVRSGDGDGVKETVIPLDEAGASERIRQAVSADRLMTIHTEEATLEDVFIEYAGRGLE
jgi:ABC-type multidrug transport system ATPase subunit